MDYVPLKLADPDNVVEGAGNVQSISAYRDLQKQIFYGVFREWQQWLDLLS